MMDNMVYVFFCVDGAPYCDLVDYAMEIGVDVALAKERLRQEFYGRNTSFDILPADTLCELRCAKK